MLLGTLEEEIIWNERIKKGIGVILKVISRYLTSPCPLSSLRHWQGGRVGESWLKPVYIRMTCDEIVYCFMNFYP